MIFDLVANDSADFSQVKTLLIDGCQQGLSRFGAFVRQRARTSIRRPGRMRVSDLSTHDQQIFALRTMNAQKQGRPLPVLPFAVSQPGQPPKSPTGILRESIVFAVDRRQGTVVIGPLSLEARAKPVPGVLEFGGEATIFGREVYIHARPFMGPALDIEMGRLAEMFEGVF